MDKTKGHGMKCLPLQRHGGLRRFPVPIYRISQQRMPNGIHMDPDLMGPSGFQTAFNVGKGPETFQHLYMSDRFLSVPDAGGHLFPVRRMSSDRSVGIYFLFPDNTMYDGPVTADNGMFL